MADKDEDSEPDDEDEDEEEEDDEDQPDVPKAREFWPAAARASARTAARPRASDAATAP